MELDGKEIKLPISHELGKNLKHAMEQIIKSIIKKTVNYTFSNELERIKLFQDAFKDHSGYALPGLPVSFHNMQTDEKNKFITMSVQVENDKLEGQKAIPELMPYKNTLQYFVNPAALTTVVD